MNNWIVHSLWAFATGVSFGVALSAPVGPVALLTIRRALAGRAFIALATGLGPASWDIAICLLSAMGVRFTASDQARVVIYAVGAVVTISMAGALLWRVLGGRPADIAPESQTTSLPRAWIEGAAITSFNPHNIVGAALIIAVPLHSAADRTAPIVTGLIIGILAWWLALVAVSYRFRHRIDGRGLIFVDLGVAALLLAMGVGSAIVAIGQAARF